LHGAIALDGSWAFRHSEAGGAYVPLDPEYPPERLVHVERTPSVPVLLTQQKLLDDGRLTINNQQSAVNSHPIVVCLDTDWEAIFAGFRPATQTLVA